MTILSTTGSAASRARYAILLGVGGLLGAMGAGMVGAAPVDTDMPALTFHYSEAELATDDGAKALYRRIVKAAEQACPSVQTGTRLTTRSAHECREQAIDRTVQKINNPRLATVRAGASKNS